MALVMHGEQCFLHEILHFIRQAGQALSEEGAQVRAQVLQKTVVRRGIAGEPTDQQVPQPVLAGAPPTIMMDSLRHVVRLQPRKKGRERPRRGRIVPFSVTIRQWFPNFLSTVRRSTVLISSRHGGPVLAILPLPLLTIIPSPIAASSPPS